MRYFLFALVLCAFASPVQADSEAPLSPTGYVPDDSIVGSNPQPTKIAVQSDGKIVVLDEVNHRLSRFNPDRTLDKDFGTFGSIRLKPDNVGFEDGALLINYKILQLLPGGKIQIVGNQRISGQQGSRVIATRYLPNGDLDGFLADSDFLLPACPGFTEESHDGVTQPDGTIFILATGRVDNPATNFLPVIYKISPNGDVDANCEVGHAPADQGNLWHYQKINMDSEGRLLVSGTREGDQDIYFTMRLKTLAACSIDLCLDTSFGQDGFIIIPVLAGQAIIHAGAFSDPDGHIWILGGKYDWFAARYDSAGRRLPLANSYSPSFDLQLHGKINQVLRQPNGSLIVFSNESAGFTLLKASRISKAGGIEENILPDSIQLYTEVVESTILPDGRVIMAEYSNRRFSLTGFQAYSQPSIGSTVGKKWEPLHPAASRILPLATPRLNMR